MSSTNPQCFFCRETPTSESKWTEISLTFDDNGNGTSNPNLAFQLLCHILTLDLKISPPGLKVLNSCPNCTFSLLKLRSLLGAYNSIQSQIDELLAGIQDQIFRSGPLIFCHRDGAEAGPGAGGAEEERLLRQEFIRCGSGSRPSWTNRVSKTAIPPQLYYEAEVLFPIDTGGDIIGSVGADGDGIKVEIDVEPDFYDKHFVPEVPDLPAPVQTQRLTRLLQRNRNKRDEDDEDYDLEIHEKPKKTSNPKIKNPGAGASLPQRQQHRINPRPSTGPNGELYYDGIEYLETETQWICTICQAAFSRDRHKQNIWKHIIRAHTKNFKYPCPFCPDSAFTQASYLREHLISVHKSVKNTEQFKAFLGTVRVRRRAKSKSVIKKPRPRFPVLVPVPELTDISGSIPPVSILSGIINHLPNSQSSPETDPVGPEEIENHDFKMEFNEEEEHQFSPKDPEIIYEKFELGLSEPPAPEPEDPQSQRLFRLLQRNRKRKLDEEESSSTILWSKRRKNISNSIKTLSTSSGKNEWKRKIQDDEDEDYDPEIDYRKAKGSNLSNLSIPRTTVGPNGELIYDGIEYHETETHWICTLCQLSFSRERSKQNIFKHIIKTHTKNFKHPCPFCSNHAFIQASHLRDHLISAHLEENPEKVEAFIGTLRVRRRAKSKYAIKRRPPQFPVIAPDPEPTDTSLIPLDSSTSPIIHLPNEKSTNSYRLSQNPSNYTIPLTTVGPNGELLYDGIEYHETETHWICILCQMSFSRERSKQNIFKHIIMAHTKNFKYPCPFCSDYGFIQAGHLREHLIIVHEPEKNPKVQEYIGTIRIRNRAKNKHPDNKRRPAQNPGIFSGPVPPTPGQIDTLVPGSIPASKSPHIIYRPNRLIKTDDGRLFYDNVEFLESDTAFTCTLCQLEFRFAGEKYSKLTIRKKLYKHIIESHTQNYPHPCPFGPSSSCTAKYVIPSHLRAHLLGKIHKDDPKTKEFLMEPKLKIKNRRIWSWSKNSQKSLLNVPKQLKKNRFRKTVNICPTCGANFRSKQSLLTHETREHNPEILSCEICGKTFRGALTLKEHQKSVHVTKTDNKCPHCSKLLATKYKLKIHIAQVHEVHQRKYICDIESCGQRYAVKSALELHQSAAHSKYEERKWKCEVCNRNFNNNSKLKAHIRKGKRHLALVKARARALEFEKQ